MREIERVQKQLHDVKRQLGGMRGVLNTAMAALVTIQGAVDAMAKADAIKAERERRDEEGVDVCEGCTADVPWGTGATDEEGITLCPECFAEEVAA